MRRSCQTGFRGCYGLQRWRFSQSVRATALPLILAAAGVGRVAVADGGMGFFSVSMSTDTEFLDISVVDPTTLSPLPTTFNADSTGRYELSGLVILNANVDEPIGDMQITGQGDPELRTKLTWKIDDIGTLFASPFVLFTTIVAGIQVEEYGPEDDPEFIKQIKAEAIHRSVVEGGAFGSSAQTNANVFAETSDGFSANVAEAAVGGPIALTGTQVFESGIVDPPSLPIGTTENGYTVLTVQHDTMLTDIDPGSTATFESTARVRIDLPQNLTGIAGDYNNDGVVNLADYTVWRDSVGAAADTLPNDPLGVAISDAHYELWTANFGNSSANAQLEQHAVPEPDATAILVMVATLLSWFDRRSANPALTAR